MADMPANQPHVDKKKWDEYTLYNDPDTKDNPVMVIEPPSPPPAPVEEPTP